MKTRHHPLLACALAGAVCLRVAFYELGLSVFMFY